MLKIIGTYNVKTLNSLMINLTEQYEFVGGNYTHPELLPEDNQSLIIKLRTKLAVLFEVLYMNADYKANCKMNIFSPKGTLLKINSAYKPSNIFSNGMKAKAILERLQQDKIYSVHSIITDDPFAYVELNEYPGIRFDTTQFEAFSRSPVNSLELLTTYGPELDTDYATTLRLIEEYKNKPVLTLDETLKKIRYTIQESPQIKYDVLDWVGSYLIQPRGLEPKYPIDTCFENGSQTLRVTGIEEISIHDDYKNKMIDTWNYTCHFEELIDGELESAELVYTENLLRIVELTNISLDLSKLSQQELEIRELVRLNGGWV